MASVVPFLLMSAILQNGTIPEQNPPVVEIGIPTMGNEQDGIDLEVKAFDESQIVQYRLEGENTSVVQLQPVFHITQNGSYTIYVYDEYDNVTTKTVMITQIDSMAPVIEQISYNGLIINNKEMVKTPGVIEWRIMDDLSGIQKIESIVNGISSIQNMNIHQTEQFFSIDLNEYEKPSDGNYHIQLVVTDAQNHKSVIEKDVSIDTYAPKVQIQSLGSLKKVDSKFYTSNASVQLTLSLTDDTGIDLENTYLSLQKDGKELKRIQSFENQGSYTFTLDEENILFECVLVCQDLMGNKNEVRLLDLPVLLENNESIIDTPSISTTSRNNKNWITEDQLLSYSIEDVQSGIDCVKYSVNGFETIVTFTDFIQKYKLDLYTDHLADASGKIDLSISIQDHAKNETYYSNCFYRDVEGPVVQYYFDKNTYNNYYSSPRTLQVFVEDLNFDPSKIRSTHPCEWKAISSSQYSTTITFDQDYEYTYLFDSEDAFGHKGSSIVESFTIDTIAPVIHPSFSATTYNEFYNHNRICEIVFDDAHIDLSSIHVNVPYIVTEKGILVSFEREGSHQLKCSVMDLAGNRSEYISSPFIIDKTSPVITFYHVQNGVSYNEAIAPVVYIQDDYLSSIEAGSSSGTYGIHQNVVQFSSVEKDGVITLYVKAVDQAQNITFQQINYKINRNGSSYSVPVLPLYFQNVNESISIQEWNLDALQTRTILVTKDGNVIPVTMDSQVFEVNGGYQYIDTLSSSNFKDDGQYVIYVQSYDGFRMNEKEIHFVKDQTDPLIFIQDIKDNGNYNVSKKSFHVTAQDNFDLEWIKVWINGKCVYESDTVFDTTLNLDESYDEQSVVVEAADKAGNHFKREVNHILVTDNILYRFITSIYVWILLVLCGGGAYALRIYKRFHQTNQPG